MAQRELVASVWVRTRPTKDGSKRYRVEYRLGGRESRIRYGGSFKTKREATTRAGWIAGELAAQRVPDLGSLAEPVAAPTLREAATRWQESRVDVAENTRLQHRSAVRMLLPLLGDGASTRSPRQTSPTSSPRSPRRARRARPSARACSRSR